VLLTGAQPNWVRPLSNASMPRSPSNGGGRRSSVRKPNFSCSVPMLQSSGARMPERKKSISCVARYRAMGTSLT
jgi:hypothetical protein